MNRGLSEWICTLPYSTTRRLLATEIVNLNHGQVTKTTPELASPTPNFRTIPTGERLSPDRFNVQQIYDRLNVWDFRGSGLELITRRS
ncbi:hypothetical protein TNCV_4831091 [Trichonephila clavipes]|nr:hypothetical protein TNCV_4831091 [Trichonephila clavipes]